MPIDMKKLVALMGIYYFIPKKLNGLVKFEYYNKNVNNSNTVIAQLQIGF